MQLAQRSDAARGGPADDFAAVGRAARAGDDRAVGRHGGRHALEASAREIAEAGDAEARRRELEEELAATQSMLPRAEDFGVHHMIDPRETRPVLCGWLDDVQPQLRGRRGTQAYTLRP